MDNFAIRPGVALPIDAALFDDQGDPITKYAGTETLAATLWGGGGLPPSCTPTATWESGPAGTFLVYLSPAQTLALAEGRYYGKVDLLDPVDGRVEAYKWSLDVEPAPGTATTGPLYASYRHIKRYGRAWIGNLQGVDDEGFLAELDDASPPVR